MTFFKKVFRLRYGLVLLCLFFLFGFQNINIGVNNQVNTGGIVGGDCIQGNSRMTEEVRHAEPFSEINVEGVFDVHLSCGDRQRVEITADSNLHSKIITKVKNGKLTVFSEGAVCTQNPMVLKITIKKTLEKIAASGSSDLVGLLNTCSSDKLLVDLEGASTMRLAGSTRELELRLQGASEFDGEDFHVQNVKIITEDATEAKIFVTDNLSGSVGGTSEVQYDGNPAHVQVDTSDIGEVSPL
ncbi:GIN domain-containing protein [Desulfomarina sp.]